MFLSRTGQVSNVQIGSMMQEEEEGDGADAIMQQDGDEESDDVTCFSFLGPLNVC